MNLRTYKATARKAHEAYTALKAAAETADYSDAQRICKVLNPQMQDAIDALRPQVCRDCNQYGSLPMDDNGWIRKCNHPNVPAYDVRTGEVLA
ncbi:hypothetical protein AMIS_19730 [Actinoplanes missouriensis 431]|uniref:Uncharacterized protein n=1 Tax=Actinoplanes missouriensis (strain ATCC 14538 / DSM 43046 / CBS 188.64 / JCM 3121 / NBRC 102363 / NCIMB 12654 / NRRL B-3342 / UNCC 431) TaxID=512565 RepID=I0H2F6_ACTM4|nr:hypothetical protein [Actinoplanes missouriensis]BAL87193.1 hypothetical protein AMIS_19730 [Actinoplanes missouriensis 431]